MAALAGRTARHAGARPPLVVRRRCVAGTAGLADRRRCVAGTAALAGRSARTAPGVAPASPLLAPEEIRSILGFGVLVRDIAVRS
jgi:hypothetical protein